MNVFQSFHEECEWSDRELLPVYGVSLGQMCEEEGCKLFFQSKNALNRLDTILLYILLAWNPALPRLVIVSPTVYPRFVKKYDISNFP